MEQLKKLAQFVANFHLEDAPLEVKEAAKGCVLDVLSSAMGAYDHPMMKTMRETYVYYEGSGNVSATVWATGDQVPLRTAAFLNAMAGHTLEMDDVHTGSKTHIGTVVIPAAWAMAEALECSGAQLLEAVIVGYEVMARIGMAFGVSGHRNRGWHVTGTAGTFGAAAACARLCGFTAEQTVSAFGLAGMQSCATWAFLTGKATSKVLNPARAAASGLESVMLVQGGMTGTSRILDAADGGIIPMMSDEYDYDLVSQGLGEVWEILKVDKKPYPCCRSMHGSIDAALKLREKHALSANDIERVDIDTYLVGLKQCGLSAGSVKPSIPTEAKFSTPYAAATALLTGKVGLSDFYPKNIADPVRQELLSRIFVHENAEYTARYPAHWSCSMTIQMKDGAQYTIEIPDASGSVTAPLSADQLRAKALACCETLPHDRMMEIIRAIETLDVQSVLPRTDLLRKKGLALCKTN